MPRIPDDEIERIKKTADLAALVRARGIELRKHGSKDLVGKCPFHADGEASWGSLTGSASGTPSSC